MFVTFCVKSFSC